MEPIKQPKLKTYQADEIIVREGELCNEMYKILSGSVVVYIRYGEKDEHVVGIYSKSSCLGEWSMFTGQPSPYTMLAYDQVLLMRIAKDSLEDFIRDNPRNAIEMMQNMANSMALIQTNVDLLLDELLYEKNEQDRKKAADFTRKLVQQSINGALEWPQTNFSIKI